MLGLEVLWLGKVNIVVFWVGEEIKEGIGDCEMGFFVWEEGGCCDVVGK